MAEQRMGVGVVGLGLMGGSLLRRLAAEGNCPAVGWDVDAATRVTAATAGLTVAPSLATLLSDCGTVFVAVPLPAVARLFEELSAGAPAGSLARDLVVSDLTSVKGPVRALAGRHRFTYVGGHPMAGTAESGFAASDAGLLAGCPWVLTLDEETNLTAWLGVAATVTALGCRVVPSTSAGHDVAVARISHLPHLLAAILVASAAGDPLALSLAAGSFRDATRVAATRAALTAAMCAGNADAIEPELAAVSSRLDEARHLLREPDRLTEFFAAAEQVRQAWPPETPVETVLQVNPSLRGRLLAVGRAGGHVVRASADGVVARTRAGSASASEGGAERADSQASEHRASASEGGAERADN